MRLIIYIIGMYIVCTVLYRSGWRFFLIWTLICAAVFYFVHESVGIWSFLSYFCVSGGPEEPRHSSDNRRPIISEPQPVSTPTGHRGTGYHPEGTIEYFPDGGTAVQSGENTYFSSGIRSVDCGGVRYYFDSSRKRLGWRVDNGNGVFYYFDDNGKEIGHCCSDGCFTDYFGDCFECR